jgi:hypothetical protein
VACQTQRVQSLIKTPTEAVTVPREDFITTAFGSWLMIGLLIDGWAHRTNAGLETFFTPWHAAFYSGFIAVAAWIIFLSTRKRMGMATGVPVGYRLGIVGLVVFAVGGVTDMVWHLLFGVESSIDALISPTHLLLLTGGFLIGTSPIRSCWHRPIGRDVGWKLAGPAVLATGLITLLAQFFYMYASGLSTEAFAVPYSLENEFPIAYGLQAVTITNVLLFGSALVLIRRWDPPIGTFTLFGSLLGIGMQALDGFSQPLDIVPAVVGGVLADVLAQRLNPNPARPRSVRTWAVTAPMALWASVVLYRAIRGEMAWPVTIWLGLIVLMGLWGLGLSVLAVSPALAGERTVET